MNIDPDLLSHWRDKYDNIFQVGDCICRALTLDEHRQLIVQTDWSAVDAEDYIVSIAVLYPEKEALDKLPAGVFTSLADEILTISGFGEVKFAKQCMDESRAKAEQVISLMKAFIIAAIPSYKDDELDKYTFAQLADKVALAEKILEVQREGSTLTLIDPEEEALKEAQKVRREQAVRKPGQATSADPIAQKLRQALGE